MPVHDQREAVETIEAAPAKVNLALHVIGQQADGYHLLEMLVTFTEAGDVIRIQDAPDDRFSISGPFAELLEDGDAGNNLVLRARDLLRISVDASGLPIATPVSIHLEKNLPVASGIGGGSADAAATLRGLSRHWGLSLPTKELDSLALKLGADVPMCLASTPLIARGIGEKITPLANLPSFSMVLVNPLQAVSTPQIFGLLETKNNAPLPQIEDDPDTHWLPLLGQMRNDLQPPAATLLPVINEILQALSDQGAELVRMSGSGATCFGLFATQEKAEEASARIRERKPDWYVEATTTKTKVFP